MNIKSTRLLSSDEATYIKHILNNSLHDKILSIYRLEVKNSIHNFWIEFHKDASLISINTLMNRIQKLTYTTIDPN